MKKLCSILIAILGIIFVSPIILALLLSFKDEGHNIVLDNYVELFLTCRSFYSMFWNTIFYSVVICLVQLVIIIPCAFGLSVARFKLKSTIIFIYIILMMMPLQVTLLPNYIGLRNMNLLDNRLAVILPMVFIPFGAVVMVQYMKNINFNIIEAARLDTSSIVIIIAKAVIPQIKACIAALFLFSFSECWNMVEQPMVFLSDNNKKTMALFFTRTSDFTTSIFMPAAIIYAVPIFLIFLCFNKSLQAGFGGLSLGGLYE